METLACVNFFFFLVDGRTRSFISDRDGDISMRGFFPLFGLDCT